ncbi:hypothetical protein BHE74_00000518 [Ensete ventricosum]|uniref:Uncharacterized protein n=1 Tax=Ensete ventricosum TaxID=4639 RepID=A0A426ZWJ0_ENSVE|nr:hypothetical protein B296_00035446 [Ensete ventricosum]RWW15026.1 hypothetical protein GW17_00021155 [Ensete ventricosum]RWW90376.1 hypothetical protein BHE74_00000518 [Ensete ventricosum]RZR87568.1 hypothetical protein BHM03_00015017 [Ensete ventricosum]
MVHVHHWLQVYSRIHQAFQSNDWVPWLKVCFPCNLVHWLVYIMVSSDKLV